MITQSEAAKELNARYYYEQITAPVTTPTITPVITPPVIPEVDIIGSYGKLILIGIGLLFLVAIYPEGKGATSAESTYVESSQ